MNCSQTRVFDIAENTNATKTISPQPQRWEIGMSLIIPSAHPPQPKTRHAQSEICVFKGMLAPTPFSKQRESPSIFPFPSVSKQNEPNPSHTALDILTPRWPFPSSSETTNNVILDITALASPTAPMSNQTESRALTRGRQHND